MAMKFNKHVQYIKSLKQFG